MSAILTAPTLKGNRKKSNVFLIFLLAILLLSAIGLGVYTIMTQQLSTKSRAEEGATSSATLDETVSPAVSPEVSVAPAEPTIEAENPSPSPEVTSVNEDIPAESSAAPATAEASVAETPTVVPTHALVSTLSCPANGASCAWDAVTGATSYNVTVVDKTTNDVVTTQTISGTSITFTAIIEHTYECSVAAVNECGTSGAGKGQNTCNTNVTPTVAQGPTATPGPGPSATPGPGPSATPAPQSGTVIVQNGPAPTIPTVGSSSTVYFMIISTILVATLFLVF